MCSTLNLCTYVYVRHNLPTFTFRGAFSEVYRVIEKETSTAYAMKVIRKEALKGKEEALQTEVEVLQKYVSELARREMRMIHRDQSIQYIPLTTSKELSKPNAGCPHSPVRN